MALIDRQKKLYLKAQDLYYNDAGGKTLMTDDEFDELERTIKAKDPKWEGFKRKGNLVKNKKVMVPLPIPMFSLDKAWPDTIDKWLVKVKTPNMVISDKLDGSALELCYVSGLPDKLYTKGVGGRKGGDVSYLIPHLKIPQKVGTKTFTVRCEGLFSKAAFQKYAHEFDAARNAASGILNRQTLHRAVKDLTVMVHQVMEPNVKPSVGLAWAKKVGFSVVANKVIPTKKLNATNLTLLLEKRKQSARYAIDGLVLTEDKINPLPKNDTPDYAKAFKVNMSAANAPVTTVIAVHWKVSSHGVLAPTVQYKPVDWEGATLEYASAFNAKFVNDNGIGKGAKIAILRSGDIIPYIVKVLKSVAPDKPSVKEFGVYTLDKKGTQYILTNPLESDEFRIQKITRFFNNIGVDFLREQTVRRLYENGFTNVKSITKATAAKFLTVPGFKETTANKLHTSIQATLAKGIPLVTLMDASGVFPRGMGSTRFETIAQHHDLLKLCAKDEREQLELLVQIPGFKEATARYFTKGSRKFLKWMDLVGIYPTKARAVKTKVASTKLNGIGVTWTSYRSKDEEQTVMENGGQVVPFGGRTTVLLYNPDGKASSKVTKAEDKGIPVLTWTQFAKRYKL